MHQHESVIIADVAASQKSLHAAGRHSRDAIVMDAPIWYHTPKLLLWCLFEALDFFLAIWVTRKHTVPPLTPTACEQSVFDAANRLIAYLSSVVFVRLPAQQSNDAG